MRTTRTVGKRVTRKSGIGDERRATGGGIGRMIRITWSEIGLKRGSGCAFCGRAARRMPMSWGTR
jgi:hypothetical protein